MNEIRKSKLFQSGGSQAIVVPHGFELPGTDITVTRDGNRLIIEPAVQKPASLRQFLDTIEPVDVEWPDVDEGLLPVEDVNL